MIRLYRRILRKYVSPYHISLKNYSDRFVDLPSAIYICQEHKATVFSALEPHIDVDSSFKNIIKLKVDLENRNIHVDVDFLREQSILYKRLIELIKRTDKEMKEIFLELKAVSSEAGDPTFQERKDSLQTKIAEMRIKMENAKREFSHVEKTFIIPFLQLPNNLHKNTTKYDEVLFSLFPKPKFSFSSKSHIQIGKLRDELHFRDVSRTSYYMKGNLAVLELALSEFVLFRFKELGFRHYANMDFAKAVLTEGCGINLKCKDDVLRVEDSGSLASNQIPFLFGGSSLPSILASFCKGVINFCVDSPSRLVSVGRKYNPIHAVQDLETKGLFTSVQSTCISALVPYPNDVEEEAVVNEVAMMLTQMYTELGLHFVLIQYGASKLKTYESLAVGICMYSPYFETYVEVGRISLCQDFISKRLQIYQSLEKKKATFLGMVYVEILDARNWIGCMIENTQTYDSNYVIPKCVQPSMYGEV